MATQDQSRSVLSNLGYTGPYGQGGAQAFLDASPGRRDTYNNWINAFNSGYTGSVDNNALKQWQAGGSGGIAPVGVVEPFNDYQKQGIESLATYAPPSPTPDFLNGAGQSYGTAVQAGQSIPISQQFATGKAYSDAAAGDLNSSNSQINQGTQDFTDADFANGLSRYYNPYQDQVINSTIARINDAGNIARNRLQAKAPGSKSFGTSADGIQGAQLDKNLIQQISDTAGNLAYQGYNTAAGYSRDDFNQARARNLQGAGQYTSNAGTAGTLGNNATSQGFEGFKTLDDLAGTGFAGNTAALNDANSKFALATQGATNKISAGTAIQDQNQRLLDAVQQAKTGAQNYDKTQLEDLANFLAQFSGGTATGATATSSNTLGKLGGLGLTLAGKYGSSLAAI